MTLTLPAILFIALVVVLLVYIVLKERTMVSRVPLAVRYAAAAVALASLVGLALPFRYQKRVSQATDHRVQLLTTGTDVSLVDSLKALGDCYTTDAILAKEKALPFVADWQEWTAAHKNAHISIHGFGLPLTRLRRIHPEHGDYRDGPSPAGLLFAQWDQEIPSGGDWVLHGRYRNATGEQAKLYLFSAAQAVDSVILPQGQESVFDLSYQPKQEGRTLLDLVAVVGKDTLQHEQVPLLVKAPQAVSVLLMASSPSFEYKFLYNWLRDSRYEVIYRARISKDKFLYASTAVLPERERKIDARMLEKTDLLVIDETEWQQLGALEQAAVGRAAAKGMGIILMIGEESPQTKMGKLFAWKGLVKAGEQRLRLKDRNGVETRPLSTSDIVALSNDGRALPLFYADGHIVAAARMQGAARVTALTLRDTYSWWLQGEERTYTKFWSQLLSSSLPEQKNVVNYIQWPALPKSQDWARLVVKGVEKASLASLESYNAPMVSDPWIPSTREFAFWSNGSGWQELAVGKDTLAFYVFKDDDWQAWQYSEQIKQNKNYFFKRYEEGSTENSVNIVDEEVPKWIFYVIFFVAVAFLWYASRNYN
ncbi:hypothetical protein [Olivibacter sp. XZL3]|uniref:hypothetical protein n=1 Tax=Olivibacter sp. XZL3 TaxID=1735116 RepID=UPI001065FB57|nr:hypothetical protein [Olivibacter sp. XZL3]